MFKPQGGTVCVSLSECVYVCVRWGLIELLRCSPPGLPDIISHYPCHSSNTAGAGEHECFTNTHFLSLHNLCCSLTHIPRWASPNVTLRWPGKMLICEFWRSLLMPCLRLKKKNLYKEILNKKDVALLALLLFTFQSPNNLAKMPNLNALLFLIFLGLRISYLKNFNPHFVCFFTYCLMLRLKKSVYRAISLLSF